MPFLRLRLEFPCVLLYLKRGYFNLFNGNKPMRCPLALEVTQPSHHLLPRIDRAHPVWYRYYRTVETHLSEGLLSRVTSDQEKLFNSFLGPVNE